MFIWIKFKYDRSHGLRPVKLGLGHTTTEYVLTSCHCTLLPYSSLHHLHHLLPVNLIYALHKEYIHRARKKNTIQDTILLFIKKKKLFYKNSTWHFYPSEVLASYSGLYLWLSLANFQYPNTDTSWLAKPQAM